MVIFIALVLEIGVLVRSQYEAYLPDYDKIDISGILKKTELSDEDYETLFLQTGLTRFGIDGLLERGLIERCGKLDVPGRPSIFRTTAAFLRTMGVSDLSELPPLPEVSGSEGLDKLQGAIDKLQNAAQSGQITISEISIGMNIRARRLMPCSSLAP